MQDEIAQYIAGGSAEQQALFGRLWGLIGGHYPDAAVKIYYGLPTFKTAAGQVSLGYWKGGVSLYTTGPQYVAAFKDKHPGIKTNKASINFPVGGDLPEADVAEVVRRAMGVAQIS